MIPLPQEDVGAALQEVVTSLQLASQDNVPDTKPFVWQVWLSRLVPSHSSA
jgi:hypothetical protein